MILNFGQNIFRNLVEKFKYFNSKKNSKKILFLDAPISFLSKNMFITFVPNINFSHKLHSHICYEKAYQHKKNQKFNIKTLIILTCSNLKNGQKISQRILGIESHL